MKNLLRAITALSLIGVIGLGCGSDSGTNGTVDRPFNRFHVDLYTIPPLSDAMVYEFWVSPIADTNLTAAAADWVSVGRFNVRLDGADRLLVDDGGNLVNDNTLVDLPFDLTDFDSVFVTIEPKFDSDSLPSDAVYLKGDIDIRIGYIVALDFGNPAMEILGENAVYTYATPTDNLSDSLNEISGVWFMHPNRTTGFFPVGLPALPARWVYEGWVSHSFDGQTVTNISTGQFTEADGAGPDQSSQYSASDNAPLPFPGEDLLHDSSGTLALPLSLTSEDKVFITLEPISDPEPGLPFPYRIYQREDQDRDPIPAQVFQLDAMRENYPKAQVVISQKTGK